MGHYFSDAWAMKRTGRHRTTIMRWRRSGEWPPELVQLARLELDGELGLIDRRWQAFRVCAKRGTLIAPGAFAPGPAEIEYTPGELLSIPWRLAQQRALDRELLELRQAELERRRFGPRRALEALRELACPHCGGSFVDQEASA